MVLLAAFGAEAQVVGLRDAEEDVHYPIALMTKAPGFVSASLRRALATLCSLCTRARSLSFRMRGRVHAVVGG